MINPDDVEPALDALSEAALRPERPPEEWLVKAWDGDTLVDLIYCPKGLPVDDDVFARGEGLSVPAWRRDGEDVMTTKLMALREHSCGTRGSEVPPHRSGTTVRVVTPHDSPATQGG